MRRDARRRKAGENGDPADQDSTFRNSGGREKKVVGPRVIVWSRCPGGGW